MSQININDLTIGQVNEIMNRYNTFGFIGSNSPCAPQTMNLAGIELLQPYEIGRCYLFRTVTMTQVGRVIEIGPQEIVLEEAVWVADTGRFYNALKTGMLNEVEPYPDGFCIVGRGAIVDVAHWNHPLPKEQK